jgi:hypothetical protein
MLWLGHHQAGVGLPPSIEKMKQTAAAINSHLIVFM